MVPKEPAPGNTGSELRNGEPGELPNLARSPFCFPRSRRVQKRVEFQRLQSRGIRVTTKHFVLLLSAQIGEPRASRIGITASKQVGNAIARNRAKRLVRETFRLSIDLFFQGIDVVVIVRKGAELLTLSQVMNEWSGARSQVKKRSIELLRPKPSPLPRSNLWREPPLSRTFRSPVVAQLLLLCIRFYQRAISPFLGANCRFSPSCSHYAAACLEGHGAARGTLLSVVRLCKCHPFHPGGYDPPPPRADVSASLPPISTPPDPSAGASR